MEVTDFDLAQIVAQASSLSERLSNGAFKVDASRDTNQQVINERLNRWCQVVAKGDWKIFHKRLQWDGLDIETVRLLLKNSCLADNQSLPTWAETLRQIIQSAPEFACHNESRNYEQISLKFPIDPQHPLPFEDVFLPAISVARQKLLARLGSVSLSPEHLPLLLLSKDAYFTLERNLLKRLINLCLKTLMIEFSKLRFFGHCQPSQLLQNTQEKASKIYYNTFVQKLLTDGLLAFFQEYAVLGRLIATRIDFWVEATAEFLQRLKADLGQIQQVFVSKKQISVHNTKLGKVTDIKPFISDPHRHGRSVIIITFEQGLKLIYKPRDLGLEVSFIRFLDWCNHQSLSLPFKVHKVLDCHGYGWVEYVEHLPCENTAAVERFYKRVGMLLCLLYALGGTDCHKENLIASGEYPVMVDLETSMHHQANLMENSPEALVRQIAGYELLFNSVLNTALLPGSSSYEYNGVIYDTSGLGSFDSQGQLQLVTQVKAINTDDMQIICQTVTMLATDNLPILDGEVVSPNDYLEEIVTGFEQMYHFLIKQRQALLAVNSPLAMVQSQHVRFIFRATHIYALVQNKALLPEFLKNGIDRSIELEHLSRAFLAVGEKSAAWPILHAELKAMEQLDVPYFGAYSDSSALTVGLEQPIEQYFREPSYNQVLARLQKLGEIDLAYQVEVIRGAFNAKVAQLPSHEQSQDPKSLTPEFAEIAQMNSLTSEELLQEAGRLAQEIQEKAIRSLDDSVNWIDLEYIPDAKQFRLTLLGESLYNGRCGIALFLAALDYITGNTQFHGLVLKSLLPLRRILQLQNTELPQALAHLVNLGGTTGLGSIIYFLVRVSQFLQDKTFLEDAKLAASLVTPELVATDQQLDLTAGAAGAILGLLTLYQETREATVLDKALICGQHLLTHRVSFDGYPRAWKTPLGERPLAGYSHGAAGIAYALLRLYAVTEDKAYLQAATEGIAYERSIFSESVANWPDFRSFANQVGHPGFMVGWCHGAPGIGLARLGSLSILDTDIIRQDIEVALQTTQKASLQGLDYLCCGNLGRCEVLLVGAQKLGRPKLQKIAQRQAAWTVARARQNGAYQLFPKLPYPMFSPTFFRGTAGIGYQLLRLAYPSALPSVLLWE